MINTVFQPSGTNQEAAEFITALIALIQRRMAVMSTFTDLGRWSDASEVTSIEMAGELAAHLRFDEAAKLWRDSRDPGPPNKAYLPMVACTDAGRKRAFEVLDQRGYQWWRKKA